MVVGKVNGKCNTKCIVKKKTYLDEIIEEAGYWNLSVYIVMVTSALVQLSVTTDERVMLDTSFT